MTQSVTTGRDASETVLGKVTSPFGIKGWVKVYSYTSPADGILDYTTWTLVSPAGAGPRRVVKVVEGRRQGKILAVRLEGVSERDQAETLRDCEIRVSTDQLPALPEGEYYWHQLEGLAVINQDGQRFGVVDHLIETGSNDVLVVQPDGASMDQQTRMIPYLPEQFVVRVDLDAGEIHVDWDPDF